MNRKLKIRNWVSRVSGKTECDECGKSLHGLSSTYGLLFMSYAFCSDECRADAVTRSKVQTGVDLSQAMKVERGGPNA